MKVLFLTNIPVPYRVDFYNELGKYCDLTVVFEATRVEGINFNWNDDKIDNFNAVFLNQGNIDEGKIDTRIFKYINKDKYDIIVATSYYYRTEMAAIIYMKLKRIPYFMETDGGIIKYGENKIKKLYKKFLVSGARGYFSPSKKSDEYLAYYGAKPDRIHRYSFTSLKDEDILENVVSDNEKAELRKKLGIPYKKVILSVGQFIHRKGFDILLEACKDINKDFGVYIVGGEPTDEYIKMKENYNLTNVHFEGFKKKEELAEYFKMADVFVLPTREDIWGLVINEAMAYGLPVVTTDNCVAGLELVDDNNGAIVPVGDSRTLAEVINNKDFISCGKVSIDKIKNHSIECMVKQHLKLFDQYMR